jgi:hypothetical protein
MVLESSLMDPVNFLIELILLKKKFIVDNQILLI